MGLIKISIDLTAIKESGKFTKSEKNGHSYINLLVADRKEPDKYDNTHAVMLDQTKEEREANAPKVYVGNGKILGATTAPKKGNPDTFVDSSSDLPF